MLNHPTLKKLDELRLSGMAVALRDQLATPDVESLSFEERLGLLVDCEPPNGTTVASRRVYAKPSCA